MPCRLLPYTSCTLDSFVSKMFASSQSTWWFSWNECCASLDLSKWPTSKFRSVPSVSRPTSACFPIVAPATCARHTTDTVRSLLLWSTYLPSSHKWVSQGVPRFENSFKTGSVRCMFELPSQNFYIRYRKLLLNEQTCINCFKHSGDAPFWTIKRKSHSIHRIYLQTADFLWFSPHTIFNFF